MNGFVNDNGFGGEVHSLSLFLFEFEEECVEELRFCREEEFCLNQ